MRVTVKQIIVSSAIALCLSQSANASISSSMKSVCDKAVQVQHVKVNQEAVETSEYTSLLTSHYNSTNCNGQQFVKQVLAEKNEALTVTDNQHDERFIQD
jgi:hypothetical protein